MEDLCFRRDKFPASLYAGDLYNRVLLALGSVVHKLSKAGDKDRATAIIDKVHSMLGLHGEIKVKSFSVAISNGGRGFECTFFSTTRPS